LFRFSWKIFQKAVGPNHDEAAAICIYVIMVAIASDVNPQEIVLPWIGE